MSVGVYRAPSPQLSECPEELICETPEGRMWIRVIRSALVDLERPRMSPSTTPLPIRQAWARRFFFSDSSPLIDVAPSLGLNVDAIREALERHAPESQR